MFNSKIYKRYYPLTSASDFEYISKPRQKQLTKWIKSMYQDVSAYNMRSRMHAERTKGYKYGYPLIFINMNKDGKYIFQKKLSRVGRLDAMCINDDISCRYNEYAKSVCDKIMDDPDSLTDMDIQFINSVIYRNKYIRVVSMYCFPVETMRTERLIKKEYKVFLTTVKGKKWVKECKRNAPSDATAGDFGDYLYDFYPEMLQ